MVEFKAGQKYGDVEIVSVGKGKIALLCGCSIVFDVAATRVKLNGIPSRCKECNSSKLATSMYSRTTRANQINIARDYSPEEKQMIKDFNNRSKDKEV